MSDGMISLFGVKRHGFLIGNGYISYTHSTIFIPQDFTPRRSIEKIPVSYFVWKD